MPIEFSTVAKVTCYAFRIKNTPSFYYSGFLEGQRFICNFYSYHLENVNSRLVLGFPQFNSEKEIGVFLENS